MTRQHMTTILAAALISGGAGCGPTAYKITPIPIHERLTEATVRKDPGLFLPKIALIDIEGLLVNARQSGLLGSGENPTALAIEKLRKAEADPAVKAVVLRINSPGGAVTASDMIYRQVQKLREGKGDRAGKPVVAMLMDVGASGAYYIACAADEIFAEPTAVTGSIGVVMLTFDIKGLFDKIGVHTDAIKSGEKKDAGSPFRPLKPEERDIFQTLINEYYELFLKVVTRSRSGMDQAKLRKLADGRVYSGQQAKQLGLVDETGDVDAAIDRAKELAKIREARVVMYHRPMGHRATVYSRAGMPVENGRQFNLINLTVGDVFPPQGYFMYLWQP